MKIKNDKYYTPKDLAKYLINKTIEIVGTNNITDIIEPLLVMEHLAHRSSALHMI